MKILVVDDDRRIIKTTCDILQIKGHAPVAAYSGEEGVEMVEKDRPDCVLMDIKMPGISGVEALKRMQRITPNLPVILASAYATEELMAEARRSGAYTCLNKPFEMDELFRVIEEIRVRKLQKLLLST
jgi:CheY-like chemotaxis protein